jgi:hypothetical protein
MNTEEAYRRLLYETHGAYLEAGFDEYDTALARHHAGVINLSPRLSKDYKLTVDVIVHLLKRAVQESNLSQLRF